MRGLRRVARFDVRVFSVFAAGALCSVGCHVGSGAPPAQPVSWAAYHPAPPQIAPYVVAQPQPVATPASGGQTACLPGFAPNAMGFCAIDAAAVNSMLAPWFGASGSQPAQPSQPRYATIVIDGALLNAAKTDGRCWDYGCKDKESREAAKAAAKVAKAAIVAATSVASASVAPYAAAFAVLAPIAAKTMSHPDAAGWAYLITNGAFSPPQELKVQPDTLTPAWNLRFQHVILDPGTNIRLQLVDADPDIPGFNGDDAMGRVNVTADDLAKAIQAGGSYNLHVAEQTDNQVLFVKLSVYPEAG